MSWSGYSVLRKLIPGRAGVFLQNPEIQDFFGMGFLSYFYPDFFFNCSGFCRISLFVIKDDFFPNWLSFYVLRDTARAPKPTL